MNINITLSVEDLTKLMRMVNQASLQHYENATKAMTYATREHSIDAHMEAYEDKQRILELITEQAKTCLEVEEAHFI